MTKTIQLRRYEVDPEQFEAFLDWWQSTLVPLRESAGFTLELALVDRERNEFLWAVSVPGDEGTFLRVEGEYMESAARREVFDGLPQRILASHIGFVDALPLRVRR